MVIWQWKKAAIKSSAEFDATVDNLIALQICPNIFLCPHYTVKSGDIWRQWCKLVFSVLQANVTEKESELL